MPVLHCPSCGRAHGKLWCGMDTYLGPATRPCTRIGTSDRVECWAERSSTDICKLCMNVCVFYLLLCSNHTNPNLFKYFSKLQRVGLSKSCVFLSNYLLACPSFVVFFHASLGGILIPLTNSSSGTTQACILPPSSFDRDCHICCS